MYVALIRQWDPSECMASQKEVWTTLFYWDQLLPSMETILYQQAILQLFSISKTALQAWDPLLLSPSSTKLLLASLVRLTSCVTTNLQFINAWDVKARSSSSSLDFTLHTLLFTVWFLGEALDEVTNTLLPNGHSTCTCDRSSWWWISCLTCLFCTYVSESSVGLGNSSFHSSFENNLACDKWLASPSKMP